MQWRSQSRRQQCTGLGVCSGTIKRGRLEAVIVVMTISFKRPSLCATTHFGYTFLDLESLTPMGKEPSWDIKNPLSKKFFIFKKCPILMILWNFPNQPKSHPSAIFGKKHAFFMKIFGQNLKTIQKHPKEGPETQKKFFSCFPPFLGFFYKKLNFGPQFGGEYHILIFSQA